MKKQINFINFMLNRLFGKVTIHAKRSDIRGQYSYGRRDMGFGDWDGVIKQ